MKKRAQTDGINLVAAFPIMEHALIAKDERDGAFIVQGDVKARNAPLFAIQMMNFALKMMGDASDEAGINGRKFGKAAISIVMQGLSERGIDPVKVMREMLEEMGYK